MGKENNWSKKNKTAPTENEAEQLKLNNISTIAIASIITLLVIIVAEAVGYMLTISIYLTILIAYCLFKN